jgi:ribosomal-protein-alanine N-acetyltransferase
MSAVPDSLPSYIRTMDEADISSIMSIETRAYLFPWSVGIFLDCLRVGYKAWVYERNTAIRGYTVMSYGAGEAHLLNLCVAPEWQRHGVGRALLGHVLIQAERLGATQIFLEVRPSNAIAIKLYQDMYFVEVGRRKGYYPAAEGREDALVLAKPLGG